MAKGYKQIRFKHHACMHSLCLLDGLGHGEEDAVDADGEHDDVVEVLVAAEVHARPPHPVPRREDAQRPRRGEALHKVLLEAPRHHAERLKEDREEESC